MSRTDRLMTSGSFGLVSSIVMGVASTRSASHPVDDRQGIVSAAFFLLLTLIGAEPLLRVLVGSIGPTITPDLIAPDLIALDLSNRYREQSVMDAIAGRSCQGPLARFHRDPGSSSLRRLPSGGNGLRHLVNGAEIVLAGCRRVVW